MSKITSVRTTDVRFPTSLELDGSDAVNVDPDYSAAYVEVSTDDGETGYGLVFDCGRGNELITAAMDSYGELLVGRDTDELVNNLGDASRRLVHDSQLRWLGPEKGVSHMACGGLVNALWDIRARREQKPLWLLLSEMSAEELISAVDFTHIRNALTPEDAAAILARGQEGKADRIAELKKDGYPAYTTTPGWLGYSDEKLVRLSREAVEAGFGMIKLKVAGSIEDDRRRLGLAREAVGPDVRIAIDANQRWEEQEAIDWVNQLQDFQPYWIEEPTSTDDILAHAAIRKGVHPVKVATGEAVHNRIIFKQLLQAGAIDVMQIDSTRVAGVNENIANLLLAAQFDVPTQVFGATGVRRPPRGPVLPSRRGSGAVRAGPALLLLRLRRRHRHHGEPGDRVRGPPARALCRARGGRRRPLPGAHSAGQRRGDAAVLGGSLVLLLRCRLAGRAGPLRPTDPG